MASAASPAKRKYAKRASGRYDMFMSGELSVEDLDQEELLRGQLRDRNGSFQGRPPLLIPREFHLKLTHELMHRAEGTIRENFDEAIQVFIDVMKDPRVRAQDRLYAAQYVWERLAGKIPEKQVVEASIRKWEEVAEKVFVDVVESIEIEDAEIVSDISEPTTLSVVWEEEDPEPDPEPLAIVAAPPPTPPRRPRRPTARKTTKGS